MSIAMEQDIKRWTAKRKSALVLDIIQGKTTVAQASRAYDLSPSEVQSWVENGKSGMENALRAKPHDVREQYERQVKDLQVESASGNFTHWLLTEPYVTLSRHTALDYTFDARNKYQCANNRGFSLRMRWSRCSACRVEMRYLAFIHLINRDCIALHCQTQSNFEPLRAWVRKVKVSQWFY